MTTAWFRSVDGKEYALPVDGLEVRDQEVVLPPGPALPPPGTLPVQPNQEE